MVMYVVMGVSGNTGSVVADRLLSAGASVRVVVRDAAKGDAWRAKGADVAVADLVTGHGLGAAFEGASGAYVLLPPNPVSTGFVAEQAAKAENIRAAGVAAGLRHLVLLSSVAAQHADGTGPIKTAGRAEGVLRAAFPNTTFVRAAYFLENWAGSFGMLDQGVFPTFLRPDVPFDMVATADIGRVAADALLGGGAGHEVIELASGSGPLSPRDIADRVGALLGRPLTVVQGPEEAVVPTLTGYGMSVDVAELYREMIAAFNHATTSPWEHTGWFVRGPTQPEQVLARLLGR
jgi:uncharacterized protein YbjT (DUF2867 family)